MAFTWIGDLSTNLDKVRHIIGDIVSTDPLLTDEQINFELNENGSDIYLSAACCIDRILAKLAREMDRSGAKFSATRSQKFQHYRDLRAQLDTKAGLGDGPSFDIASKSDAESIESNTDFVPPIFKVGQDDNT